MMTITFNQPIAGDAPGFILPPPSSRVFNAFGLITHISAGAAAVMRSMLNVAVVVQHIFSKPLTTP